MEEKGLVYFGYYCCTIFLKSYLCLFSSMVLLSRTVGSFKIIIVKSEIQAIFLSLSINTPFKCSSTLAVWDSQKFMNSLQSTQLECLEVNLITFCEMGISSIICSNRDYTTRDQVHTCM